jgi:dinuclear metal center YbgI/SA1388 family protein
MLPTVELSDIVAYLDDLLQVSRYTETGTNGLLWNAGEPVARIAAAVNTTFETIQGARREGCQLLLVHHPAWPHIDLHLKEEKEEALRLAGVSLYASHAPLDCASEFGNSATLARLLGIRVEGRFLGFEGGHAGVYGVTDGDFPALVERVRRTIGNEIEAHQNTRSFGRVAVVTGAGGWTAALDEARRLGCDTFVTGEGSMHTRLFARETGMNLILGGHYATEAPGIRGLARIVGERFGLPWRFIPETPPIG